MKNKLGIIALVIALLPIVLFFILPFVFPLSPTVPVKSSTYLVFIAFFILLLVSVFVLSIFALRRESERRIFPILALAIILLPVLVVGVFIYQDYRTSKIVSHRETYTDSEYGFKINYNGKWSAIATTDKNINLQLKHSSGCILSYGKIDTEALSSKYNSYQFNEITRDFWEKETKDIYLQSSHFKIISFWQRNQNGGGTKYIGVYVNHFPQTDSQNSLVLYSNGSTIDNDCVNDFLTLLTSGISLRDSLYIISPSSNGTIERNVSFNSVGMDPQWENTKTVLVFRDRNGNEQVLAYLDLYSNSAPQMQLAGNKIYFVGLRGQLSSIDLLSKQIEDINLPEVGLAQKAPLPNNVVNDFFIYKNNLYYLFGENCNYYMAKCNLTLQQYDLASEQSKMLAKNIDSLSIVGYDPVLNKLYMRWAFGDAGFASQSITEYDFNTNEVNLVATANYSMDGSSNPTEDQKIKIVENSLKGQLNRINEIIVNNGQIIKNQTLFSDHYPSIRYIQN